MRWLRDGKPRTAPQDDHWIPLSDLMTGLMMMFLLVAVIFMVKVEAQASRMRDVARDYDRMREQLYLDLDAEFRGDLPRWRASLDRDLTIRFEEPEVLFDTGQSVLKPQFRTILSDFFPRYVRILSAEKYRNSIEEIRIEGHTSSIWSGATPEEAYIRNMELSQARTRSALQFILALPQVSAQRQWLVGHLTANGLSSSRVRNDLPPSERSKS
jgi:outer membrane protein OmpA-like peptidoglycan-associated protein